MRENGHRSNGEVDPWNRLVAMIDRKLTAPIDNQHRLIELWRDGMRDAELRAHGEERWAGYREPLLETVVEGCNAGAFTPTLSPEEVVDLVLAMLAGAMVTRVLQFAAPSADGFRITLLHQVAQMLGRA